MAKSIDILRRSDEFCHMKLGYARVSRTDQNLDAQMDALKAAGAEKIFTDKMSGAKARRPGLEQLLEMSREGDRLIIWKLDRLGRSLKNLIEISEELTRRKIELVSLKENIDTGTTAGRLFFHIFGALAECERDWLIERTRAGLEAARMRGTNGGRRPSLTVDQFSHAEKLLAEGKTAVEVAGLLNVSERTIRRIEAGEYRFSEKKCL
jgi:DNA invertase Pin-like site-specific DNA recombinase